MTAKQKLALGFAGLLLYLVLLVANMPAQQVLPRLSLPATLQLQGVSGTLWQGNAQTANIKGVVVKDLQWQMGVLPLLWGSIALDLDGGSQRDQNATYIKGGLTLSRQSITADNLDLFIPAPAVLAQVPLPVPVQAQGRFKLAIDTLNYEQSCQDMTAKGEWLKGQIMTTPVINLGHFSADISCNQGQITLAVAPPNSLNLSVQATVDPELNLRATGQFKPEASLPKLIHDTAKFFGQPGADGFYQIAI